MPLKAVPVNDDDGLEQEADVMGEKAAQMDGVRHDCSRPPSASLRGQAAQLPKLGIGFDGWRSGRRLAGRRHFVADTA